MRHVHAAVVLLCALAASPAAAQDEECTYTVGKSGSASISEGCEREMAAMSGDDERADYLFRLGYSMVENEASLGALTMLERAVALAPDNAKYWHELAFVQGDLGFYREALASIERAMALDPELKEAFSERAWLRENLGEFAGANDDYDNYFSGGGESPTARMSYARNLVWMGRIDEAEAKLDLLAGDARLADEVAKQRNLIERIRGYRPKGDEAARCEISTSLSDRALAEQMFDICTRAFLDSSDPEKRGDYLTVRATVRQVIEQSRAAGYDDLRIAAGIDPENGNRHVNTGFSLLQGRHSWAARNEFDKAIAMGLSSDLNTAIALAGRAQANFNLEDRDAAIADAKKSFEIEPNEAAAWVLGEIAFAEGDKNLARTLWMESYRLGSRDDGLIESLKSVGVDDPDNWRSDAED